MKIVCTSGGFDPSHNGHISYFRHAKEVAEAIGGKHVVILNSDAWLERKKGYKCLTWEQRAEILRAIRYVDEVVAVDDSDGTVMEALRRVKPDYFCNGGDRTNKNTPEQELCGWLGIQMLWGVGGHDKLESSSELVKRSHRQPVPCTHEDGT